MTERATNDLQEAERAGADPEEQIAGAFSEILGGEPEPVAAEPAAEAAAPEPQAGQAAEAATAGAGGEEGAAAAAAGEEGGAARESTASEAKPWEKRYWDSQEHIRRLTHENAEMRAREAAKAELEKLQAARAAENRPLTEEERLAYIEQINKNPRDFVKTHAKELADQVTTTMQGKLDEALKPFRPLLAQAEREHVLRELVQQHPQLEDPAFAKIVSSRENVAAAFAKLPESVRQDPDAPSRLYKDPVFQTLLVQTAREVAAAKHAETAARGAADQATQAAAARAGAAMGGGGGGKPGSGASKETADDKLRRTVVSAGGMSFDHAFNSNFKAG